MGTLTCRGCSKKFATGSSLSNHEKSCRMLSFKRSLPGPQSQTTSYPQEFDQRNEQYEMPQDCSFEIEETYQAYEHVDDGDEMTNNDETEFLEDSKTKYFGKRFLFDLDKEIDMEFLFPLEKRSACPTILEVDECKKSFEAERKKNRFHPFQSEYDFNMGCWIIKNKTTERKANELIKINFEKLSFRNYKILKSLMLSIPTIVSLLCPFFSSFLFFFSNLFDLQVRNPHYDVFVAECVEIMERTSITTINCADSFYGLFLFFLIF